MSRLTAFLALTFTVLGMQTVAAQLPPDQALKSLTVADGLQVELFAAEPMFVNPTCIDVDHKGRVWVCESVNYRCDLRKVPRNRKEGDRLVVLEDTDGDGKADKAHTFYQEKDFIAPLGIAVAPVVSPDRKGGESLKVYVCHSPHIYVFEDKDGDLKADGPPKTLLTGFNGYDHDHGVHGLHFGPDGRLYFSVGDQGVNGLKSASGVASAPRETKVWKTNQTDCRAGTCWRCDADGGNLELLAHNFRNQYEPAVDSFGTMFVSDNDDDGNQQTRICHVMYGGNYGYWPRGKGESHWHEEQPGVVHKVLRTGFGSPTGLCWYEGELLQKPLASGVASAPRESLYGLLLHTDAGPREVRCFQVKPKGAGYTCDQLNLVTSTDNWFRPSDVCVAPDGSIMVSDWYDPGVGGHGMGDTTRGRIYRLTPKGHIGYKMPDIDLQSTSGLSQAFFSPNLSARQGAALTWRDKSENDRVEWLRSFEHIGGRPEHDNARVDWLRSTTKSFEAKASRKYGALLTEDGTGFAMPTARARQSPEYHSQSYFIYGARMLRDYYGDVTNAPEPIRRFFMCPAKLPAYPATEREMLVSLRDADPVKAKDWVYALAKHYDGQDHFYLAAIGIAVGTDPKRREIILADFERHFPEWNDKVAKLVWELRPPQVIAKLDQRLNDAKLTAEQKGMLFEILASAEGDTGGLVLVRRLAAKETPKEELAPITKTLVTFLPNKWAGLKLSRELRLAVDQMLAGPSSTPYAIDLIGAGEMPDQLPALERVIGNEKDHPVETRQAAVRAISRIKNAQAANILSKLMENQPLRKEAIRALGAMQTIEAMIPLQATILDARKPEELRLEALAALASSRQGTVWLLEQHRGKTLSQELLPEVGRLLRNSPHQDLRNRAMIAFPAPGKMDVKKLPEIAKLLNRRGDAEHGRALMVNNKDLGCVRCHSVRGTGGQIGPDLSMIGKKASRENLFESILLPDKAVADQFVQFTVLDQNGVTMVGLLVEETKDHVILRDANGKDTKILTKDIDQKAKSPRSIMPSDLLAYMTEQDLLDMVAYLETLKTPALAIDSWNIIGPHPNGNGDEGLDKEHIAEPKPGGSFAVPMDAKPRIVKPNAEGYVNLLAFHAPGNKQIVSYLYQQIESPADQEATLLVGTDDGCKLWVNGDLMLAHKRHEAAAPERDTVKVKLKKGSNSIVLKINQGDGPHGFYFSVVSEQELKLAK